MAAAIWNNVLQPVNVNGDTDGVVSGLDALLIINELNNPFHSDPETGSLPRQVKSPVVGQFLDVTCDGIVSPVDVLQVVNHINNGDSSSTRGGKYASVACSPQLLEGNAFSTELSQVVKIPDNATAVKVFFQAPEFDFTTRQAIRDAFEIEVTDTSGNPIVFPYLPGRDALYNWSEDLEPLYGAGTETTTEPGGEDSSATINLSGLAAGTEVRILARLVNNDVDNNTSVILRGFEIVAATSMRPAGVPGAAGRFATPTPVDMSRLDNLTSSFVPSYGRTTLAGDNNELITELMVTNRGNQTVTGQIIVAIENITELDAAAMHPDGILPDGRPYFDLTHEMQDQPLAPGESLRSREIRFKNNSGNRFTYKLSTYGSLNAAPSGFTSEPLTLIEAGKTYKYTAKATDPDDQALVYSIVAGPEVATIDAANGRMTWLTEAADIGSHRVTLRATDPHGLFVEQSFTIEVLESLQNRPPLFVSDPVTDAIASSGFEITTVATGVGPTGVSVINGFRGPGLVTLNAGDQSLSQIDSLGNDRFDLPIRVSVGEPAPTGQVLRSGYSVDVGLPAFEHSADSNEISGMDQADLNGDGTPDLVVSGFVHQERPSRTYRQLINVTLGNPDGTFGEAITVAALPATGSSKYSTLRVADFDNDGRFDILTTDRQTSTISFLRGDGQGDFSDAVSTPLTTNLYNFKSVDLDQDGNLDIVGMSNTQKEFGYMRGRGDGSFDDFVSIYGDPAGPLIPLGAERNYAVADMDGDGDIDIVVSDYRERNISVLSNDGALGFSVAVTLDAIYPFYPYSSTATNTVFAVFVGDFNGDSHVDIAYGSLNGSSGFDGGLGVYLGDGSGASFVYQDGADAIVEFPNNAAGNGDPIDIDNDGDLDIVVASSRDGRSSDGQMPSVLINRGDGTFTTTNLTVPAFGEAPYEFTNNEANAKGVLVGDYNQDGLPDISTYRTHLGGSFASVTVVLADRPGVFASSSSLIYEAAVNAPQEFFEAGDFNNDGIVDLWSPRYQGISQTWLGRGDGSFEDPFPATPNIGNEGLSQGTVEDFNHDGILDVFWVGFNGVQNGPPARYLAALGNGDGTFEITFREPSGSRRPDWGDFNGDGYLDFAASKLDGVQVFLYDVENPGTWVFDNELFYSDLGVGATGYNFSMSIDDFDQDGNSDIGVVTKLTDEPFRLVVYPGLGDGTFTTPVSTFYAEVATDYTSVSWMSTGDFNEDGIPDVAVYEYYSISVHLGVGDGTFGRTDIYPAWRTSTSEPQLFVRDINHDGHDDVLFTDVQGSQSLGILLGNGDGSFQDRIAYDVPTSAGAIAFGDFDNDGRDDVVANGRRGGNFATILNGARRRLTDIVSVDLNSDGNADVLATNTDNSRVKWFLGDNLGNLNRQPDLFTDFGPVALTVFDLDRNGVTEIITANRSGRSISVFSGGVDNWTRNDIAVGQAPIDVLSGSLDGDTSPDLLVIDEANNALWVLMGNGDTTFKDPVAVPLGDRPNDFLLADVDADGNNDVVVSLPDSKRIMILPGDGLGGFTAPHYVTLTGSPTALAAVDFNDDGNLDLSATLGDLDQVAIIYGRGGNQFARPQLITVGDNPIEMSAEDADDDGRVDLIVSNQGDDTLSVIYNRFDPNEVYRYDADAVDPDDDPLTYAIVDGPGGLIINSETGALLWAASPDQVGEHSVTISADDGRGGVATQTYKIDVQPARENATPLFATEAETTIGANEIFTYQATALDNDNDAVRYRLLDGPVGAAIDPTTGLVTWDGRGEALLFNEFGQAGLVEAAQSESYKTPSVTVEGWYKIDNLTASNGSALLFEHLTDSGHYAFRLQIFGNNKLQLYMHFADSGTFRTDFNFIPETDRWYHFAMAVDDAAQLATVFVDGETIGSFEMPSSLEYGVNRSLTIGRSQATVDNFRVWSVARTQAEIREGMAQQYDDGPLVTLDYRFNESGSYSVYDSSIYRNDGYLGGSTIVPRPTFGLTDPGDRSFTISVEDGRGGFDTQAFVLEVLPEQRGSIIGHLFDDLNGDGDQDDGSEAGVSAEPSLENWQIYIDANGNAYPDPSEPQTITDADGDYRFDGLLPGAYPVRISPVAGYDVPTGTMPVSVSANEESAFDLAIEQLSLSHIRGQLLTEDAEAAAYWKVFADLDDDGSCGENEPMAVTDRHGDYALTGLDAGTYTIRPDLPAGWADTAGRDGLTVTLADDEISTGNDFVLEPTNTSVTGGVHFVTMPSAIIEARQTFRYASIAMGIASGAIHYDLSLAPDGMTVGPDSGLVAWRPAIDQVGEHLVILRATGASGSISLHDFYLQVTAPNTSPVIVTPAASAVGSGGGERHGDSRRFLNAYAGISYTHDVIAQDAEFTDLTFSLTQSPTDATIDPATGRLSWTPTASDVGSHEFTVEVIDEAGAATSATWTVEVKDETPTVLPLDVSLPRATAAVTVEYFSRISATDQLGRPVSWTLANGPAGLTVGSDGTLRWTPASDQLGTQSVELNATTADGTHETVSFDIEVTGRSLNAIPSIDSTPITSVSLDQAFAYDVIATDSDRDIFAFTLLESPVGMSVHPSLGTIRWTPEADQLGEHDVLIQVSDPSGDIDEQAFKLKVSRFGGPPRIASVPPTEAAVGNAFLYTVEAIDRENDPLTYTLLTAPAGMSIVETTGELSWTPTAGQLGQQDVVIQVSDGVGGAATQAFAVRVSDGVPNLPPTITSSSPRFGTVGTPYSYTLAATDPENTVLTYTLGRGPAGMSVDANSGLVTWTPTAAQAGKFVVTLIATDAGGASAVESFEFDVLAQNTSPVIRSTAPVDVAAGALFMYDVLASDADVDQLQYALTEAPAGAEIDSFGRIRWETDVPLIGSHEFTVQVTDPRGGEAIQSFTIEVIEDLVAPKLSLIVSPGDNPVGNLPWGTQFKTYVKAIDNVAIASLTLEANGRNIPLDAAGTATFTFEEWKFATINATATAVDTNGNNSSKTITFAYDFPQGWNGQGGDEVPTAIISTPTEAESVTGMVSIVGTASHEDFASYRLSYRHVDDSQFTQFHSSDVAVQNGELGVWDTSLLLNDEYVIRLEVATNEGVVNVDQRSVGLAGELKLGNFRLSFTDMVIPVAGIPIEITRIYDTLQADREGDFGYGWRLEYRNTDLRVGLPKSGLEDIGIYSPLRPGVKVYLNVPGEGRQGFTFNPSIRVLPGFGRDNNLVLARPRFTPDPGVTSSLSTGVSQYLLVNAQGELHAPGGIPYNPASPDFGGAYVLTTREGTAYRIDGATGRLRTATDRVGRTLTFNEEGITTNGSDTRLEFHRDAAGRVREVIDPEGNIIRYEYSAAGDLLTVTDREENVTTISYDGQPHYVTDVMDTLGRTPVRAEYGPDGRLQSILNLDGTEVAISYDPRNRIEIVEDDVLGKLIVQYDGLGNVVSQTDALGRTEQYAYDVNGRLKSQTSNDGNTRYQRRDRLGNLVAVVDSLGNETSLNLDSAGRVTAIIGPDGTTEEFRYDDSGNLVEEIDSRGSVYQHSYDSRGNLSRTTDPLGRHFDVSSDGDGRPIELTRPSGGVQTRTYDRNGNLTSISGAGADGSVTVSYSYNANGEVIAVDGPVGASEIIRDDAGRVIGSVDPIDRRYEQDFDDSGAVTGVRLNGTQLYQVTSDTDTRTETTQTINGQTQLVQTDAAGRPIEVLQFFGEVDANATPLSIVYDDAGRVESIGGQTVGEDAVRTEYDALGREVRSENGDGIIERSFDVNGQIKALTINGVVTEYEYDNSDNLIRQTLPEGGYNQFEYDALGRLVAWYSDGQLSRRYEYDADDNMAAVIDAANGIVQYRYDHLGRHVETIDSAGGSTKYRYGPSGERTEIVRNDGSSTKVTHDAAGRIVRETQPDGTTLEYEYDDFDRLVRRFDGDETLATFQYDTTGGLSSIENSAGTVSLDRDNSGRVIRQEFAGRVTNYSYDDAGRLQNISTPGGTRSRTYNESGLISSVTDTAGGRTDYAYDAQSRMIGVEHPDGSSEVIVFNDAGLIGRIDVLDQNGQRIDGWEYTYDARGRLAKIDVADGTSQCFEYDSRGYLIVERYDAQGRTVRKIDYHYDLVGNRTLRREAIAGNATVETVYEYDSSNRLIRELTDSTVTDYEYDANGQQVLTSSGPADRTEYEWDRSGRLVVVRIVTSAETSETVYSYDGLGRRIKQDRDGTVTFFLYDESNSEGRLLEEIDGNGNVLRSFSYGNEIVTVADNGRSQHPAIDALGDVRGYASDGAYEFAIQLDAFGRPLGEVGDRSLLYYRGEYLDAMTGLYHLTARQYDPNTGRFLSIDPIEGTIGEPLSHHDYVYASNDPIRFTDQLGLSTLGELLVSQVLNNTLFRVGIAQFLVGAIGRKYYDSVQWSGPTLKVQAAFTGDYTIGFAYFTSEPRQVGENEWETRTVGVVTLSRELLNSNDVSKTNKRRAAERFKRQEHQARVQGSGQLNSGVKNDAAKAHKHFYLADGFGREAQKALDSIVAPLASVGVSIDVGNATVFAPGLFKSYGGFVGTFTSISIGFNAKAFTAAAEAAKALGINASFGAAAVNYGFSAGYAFPDTSAGLGRVEKKGRGVGQGSFGFSIEVGVGLAFDIGEPKPSRPPAGNG